MKRFFALTVLCGMLVGCGPEPVDTSKSAAPKSPEEMKAEIERAMKEKGMSAEDYGKAE